MNRVRLKQLLFALALFIALTVPYRSFAQFVDFIPAIPARDTNGLLVAGGNTTFADGSTFQPAGNDARSSNWAWRPFGNDGILSSLGLTTNTAPANTKELVTTASNLKPGSAYTVYALFWNTGQWGLRAGLNSGTAARTNTWFDADSSNVITADLLPWQTMPTNISESGRTLYAAPLGVATANSNGQVKAFIHDLPTGDSNRRTWYQGIAVAETPATAPSYVLDAAAAGTSFHPAVRGHALADITINRGEYWVGIPKALEVARGSAIRGVATGIAAELYDWRTRNGQARPPTLQFLRYSRDFQSELFLGVNMRGLVQPNPAGGFLYYDTQPSTLATVAADWVRYVNHIVPTYRQGDNITDARDASILNSLTWSSGTAGDSFDKLLAPGEAAVPQVQYWEIGNEPTVGTTAYSVSNSFTLNATNYYARYKAIVRAMKAENPNIKVGPTIIYASREPDQLAAIASDLTLPIDFVAYHPYEKMGLLDDPAQITLHLGSVYSRQLRFYNEIKKLLADNGRNPETIEYATTEVNVSDWPTNDKDQEARIAHALGTVETVFTHARLGLIASHYWIWPTHRWDGTPYPSFKAYEKLRDHMGDTIVSVYAFKDIRVYTTRDSKTGELAVWALNFSNDQNTTINLKLQNLTNIERATLFRLQDTSGITTLQSSNPSSEMLGGPAVNVDWTQSDVTAQDFKNLQLNLPAATLTLLAIEPGIEELTPTLNEQSGQKWFSVQLRPLRASNVRYRLLRSSDLATWETVTEVNATGSESLSISDPTPVGQAKRFFRVELLRD